MPAAVSLSYIKALSPGLKLHCFAILQTVLEEHNIGICEGLSLLTFYTLCYRFFRPDAHRLSEGFSLNRFADNLQ